jgi:phosphate/sulfate permease
MYGFMCVAATAAIWDNTATYLGLPVSTTHTTGAALLPCMNAVPQACMQGLLVALPYLVASLRLSALLQA